MYFSIDIQHRIYSTIASNNFLSDRRPCSDFMDMLRRLISRRIIIIIITAKTTEQNRIVRTGKFELKVTNNLKNSARGIVLLKQ